MDGPCPHCGAPQGAESPDPGSCAACGIVFAKWSARAAAAEPPTAPEPAAVGAARIPGLGPSPALPAASPEPAPPPPGWRGAVAAAGRFGHVGDGEAVLFVALRGVLLLALAWAGWRFAALNQPYGVYGPHFLHNAHLVFHEAGHIVFIPFGRFMTVLGGSLMQLIVPLVCVLAFLRRMEPFGAAVAVWWLGTSFVDLSPYIGDAQSLKLMMIGGFLAEDVPDAHDWRYILYSLDVLRYDREIAQAAHLLGAGLMVLGLAWGGWMLWRQYRACPRVPPPGHLH